MKQQNKIIVVGATSGLGRMLAERYIRDGHVEVSSVGVEISWQKWPKVIPKYIV